MPSQLLAHSRRFRPLPHQKQFLTAAHCRFVVLVCGTLVYGKGDEAAQQEELKTLQANGELPLDVDGSEPSAPVFAPVGPARSAPMTMGTPSSFKASLLLLTQ